MEKLKRTKEHDTQKVTKARARPMQIKKIPGGKKNPLIKTIEKIKIDVPEGCPNLHTTAVFVGSCNSGKTNWMLNLAKEYCDFKCFNRIFVLSPTYENNHDAFKILPIHPDDVYSGRTVLNHGVECVLEIENKMKKAAKEYEEYEEYCKAYEAWEQGTETMHQDTLLKNNYYAAPVFMPRPSVLMLMDDLSNTSVYSRSTKNGFINLLLRHRHVYEIGLTIFMCVQNFNTGVPKILRQNIKQFFLWKTHDSTQLKAIYEQVAQGCTEEEFYEAFEAATREPHDFLTVDLASKTGSVFRRNFDEEILFLGEEESII
jgi:hypothetical protein